MSKMPYVPPEESELPGRPGYEVTQESRFDADPDAGHLPSCTCTPCIDRDRCPKCGKRGGVNDCSTCRILAMKPHERGAYPYPDTEGLEDHNPVKPEMWPTIRYNGQRIGDPVRTRPACAACGCTEREKLWQVNDAYKCLHHLRAECVARVAASRLRLVKAEQP